jgi:hypothetical protein
MLQDCSKVMVAVQYPRLDETPESIPNHRDWLVSMCGISVLTLRSNILARNFRLVGNSMLQRINTVGGPATRIGPG